MFDGDWGMDQWDVDSKAEALNKSLFGKRRKTGAHSIKPDLNINAMLGTDDGQDSGDDNNEKLSKKSKKKLKEKRRKENMKKKKTTTLSEQDVEHVDRNNEIKKSKPVTSLSKKLSAKGDKQVNKLKMNPKIKAGKVLNGKKEFPKNGTDDGVSKKKEKRALSSNDKGKDITSLKKRKIEEQKENSDLLNGDAPKRKRKKKKKPSSKKNKYKHLGLKSDRPVLSDSDSGNESDQVRKTKLQEPNNNLASSENKKLSPETGMKRKRSMSPEKVPNKKTKLIEEKPCQSAKMKKEMKTNAKSKSVDEKNDLDDSFGKEIKKLKNRGKNKSIDNEVKMEAHRKSISDIRDEYDQKGKSASKKLKKEKSMEKSKKNIDCLGNEEEGTSKTKNTISPFFSSQGMEQQQKCVDKLTSGRFRFINEQLYTIKGGEAFRMFQKDKTLMDAYNTGFQNQVKQWNVNPLDIIIKQLNNKPSHLKVADFGCGEARLAASVPQKVHSLDLYALNERVTVCNMAKTPLESGSLDIAIFCLSLMGTNLNDYLLEANRVLKEGGILKIAEVVSRFTNFNNFVSAVTSMGFRSVNSRELSKMFYLMDFKKVKSVNKSSKQIKAISLNPCVYKKR